MTDELLQATGVHVAALRFEGQPLDRKVASKIESGEHDEVSVLADSLGSELVLGFVGPVGVANSRFHIAAMDRLRAFGYHPQLIRLSERLDDLKAEGLLTTVLRPEPEFERDGTRYQRLEAVNTHRRRSEYLPLVTAISASIRTRSNG